MPEYIKSGIWKGYQLRPGERDPMDEPDHRPDEYVPVTERERLEQCLHYDGSGRSDARWAGRAALHLAVTASPELVLVTNCALRAVLASLRTNFDTPSGIRQRKKVKDLHADHHTADTLLLLLADWPLHPYGATSFAVQMRLWDALIATFVKD